MSDIRTAAWAHSPIMPGLAKAAIAERADLYIGHCLGALPAVAHAACHYRAKTGFDAEDDHLGELDNTPDNRMEIALRRRIEEHFLPVCHHLTASSPGIADAYRARYGVTMLPILNVFPLTQAPDPPAFRRPNDCALSIYWFSQTIGPGRGLEFFIKSMGKMRARVTLSIRGSDFLGYSRHLRAAAADAGVAERVYFLKSAPPDEMVRLAAQYDVGLASELSTPSNRAISLTNKIFVYLLAAIPVLLSDTPAQRQLATKLGLAARLIDLSKPEEIASAVDEWATKVDTLVAAKHEAWQLARTRFNWDFEKQLFLKSIRGACHEC
jgi:glycosyltransferase involved in cell wall biosynthesis